MLNDLITQLESARRTANALWSQSTGEEYAIYNIVAQHCADALGELLPLQPCKPIDNPTTEQIREWSNDERR